MLTTSYIGIKVKLFHVYNAGSTVGANNVSPSMHRSRLSSAHVRELAHGNFVVKYEDINLLESIGEGYNIACLRIGNESISIILI